jgi:small subunit ribosomal protein S27Ae
MSKKPTVKKEDIPVAASPTVAAAEAAPAAKPQKAEKKREKKHREEKGVHAMYKAEGDKVSRARPTCERCGPGYFMGDHHDRYTCGRCGFTRYKQK